MDTFDCTEHFWEASGKNGKTYWQVLENKANRKSRQLLTLGKTKLYKEGECHSIQFALWWTKFM